MQSHLSLVLLFFFSLSTIFAQEANQTLVWKVSGNDFSGKSYIVGTLPIRDSIFYQYPKKTFQLISKTNAFASFDNEDLTTTATNVRKKSFQNFDTNFAIYPVQYFELLATQEMKPIIRISNSLSYQQDYQPISTATIPKNVVNDNFNSGNLTGLLQNRLSMDINESIYNKVQNDYNYLLAEQLIQQMRAQSLFFPVDIVYLEGQNGLINLLKARGYTVTPMFERDFKRKAKEIAKQKELREQLELQNTGLGNYPITDNNQMQEPAKGANGLALMKPTKKVKLKLPIGIINLKNWASYSLLENKLSYLSPNRLKSVSDYEQIYETTSNDLTYSIKFVDRFSNKKEAIEKLVIDNGGQLTYVEERDVQGYSALEVELIYSENLLSKHLIINYPVKTIIASVKGPTPQIFSLEQNKFFNNISLEQIQVEENNGLNPNIENVNQPQPWIMFQVNEMNLNLPVQPTEVSSTLENGKKITTFVIPRGEVDDNLYLFSSIEKEPMPLFKLFNEAINTAVQQSRAVIVDRDILPADKPYYSYYLLKDAVDNYYKIEYYYIEGKFYQAIVKGSKKTLNNQNAKNVLNSIYFPSVLPPISN